MGRNVTFVLGLGAQKAGTTWLHAYLKSFPEARMGLLKEYQIWDALRVPTLESRRVRAEEAEDDRRSKLRYALQQNPSLYFDYFSGLLSRKGARITADISPTYSGLKAPHLKAIRREFRARNVNVKAIFLMRDPVQRCWSNVRMSKTREDTRTPGNDGTEAGLLRRNYESVGMQIRTNYHSTIVEVEKAFPADEVYYDFYERLFLPERVKAISNFIGVEAKPNFVENKFNVGSSKAQIPDDLASLVARHYQPVYDFCGERFPEVKDLWSGYRYLSSGA